METKKMLPIIIVFLIFLSVFSININAGEGDYAGMWSTSPSTKTGGITTDGVNIWILDYYGYVYKFDMEGDYLSSFETTHTEGFDNGGIAKYGNFIYIRDAGTAKIHNYTLSGGYNGNWTANVNLGPGEITSYDGFLWIVLHDQNKVEKYDLQGNYIGCWTPDQQCMGIATDGVNIWLTNYTQKEVYKYHMDGEDADFHWDYGFITGTSICTDGNFFWMVNDGLHMVYKYDTDDAPPSPDPSTWDSEPEPIAAYSITMTATTVSDADPPILYYFDEITGNGTDSGWQESPTYVDHSIASENTECAYRVKCRDYHGNMGNYSSTIYVNSYFHIYTLLEIIYSSTSIEIFGLCYNVTGDVGFLWGNNSVNQTVHENNETAFSDLSDHTGGYWLMIDANASTYYHYMAWYNDGEEYHFGEEKYFIMPPTSPPNDFEVNNEGYGSINLSWTNSFDADTSANQSTIIRMSNDSYPTWTEGVEIYNDTGTWYNKSALLSSTTYFFSAWTYVNDTHSPILWSKSQGRTTTSGTTLSGLYTISVRYENSTYGYIPLNLDTRDYHKHIFYVRYFSSLGPHILGGSFEENYYEEGKEWYITDSNLTDTDETDGSWTINATNLPREMEFQWKGYDTVWWFWENADFCTRTLVVDQFEGQNITFYLRTDLEYVPLALGTMANWANKTFLGEYQYTFADNHGSFSYEDNAYVYIYLYAKNGDKMIIHSEYLDLDMQITPTLVFGKIYYMGIKSDVAELEYIGKAPTGAEDSVVITIPAEMLFEYAIWDHIDVSLGRSDTLLYLDYTDLTESTISVSMSVANYHNRTIVYTEEMGGINNYNFTFTTVDGYDKDEEYVWRINVTFQALGTFTTGWIPILTKQSYIITDVSTLDDILALFFGPSPVSAGGISVGYAYLGVLILALLGLLSFKPEQAHVGLMVEGLIFILAAGAIAGLESLFANYSWIQGVVLGAAGLFIFILGLWAALAGRQTEKEDKKT